MVSDEQIGGETSDGIDKNSNTRSARYVRETSTQPPVIESRD